MRRLKQFLIANKKNELLTQQFVQTVIKRQPHSPEQLDAFVKRTIAIIIIAITAGSLTQIMFGVYQDDVNAYLCDNELVDSFACDVWRAEQEHPNASLYPVWIPCSLLNNDSNNTSMCRGIGIRED